MTATVVLLNPSTPLGEVAAYELSVEIPDGLMLTSTDYAFSSSLTLGPGLSARWRAPGALLPLRRTVTGGSSCWT